MTGREVARLLNVGRVALGVGLVIAPRRLLRTWIGADADRPGTAVVARAHGTRDAVLGALALHTLDHPQVGPRYQRTVALCDAVDFGVTVMARRSLPRSSALVALMAIGAVGAQLWAASELASAQGDDRAGGA